MKLIAAQWLMLAASVLGADAAIEYGVRPIPVLLALVSISFATGIVLAKNAG